MPWHVANGSAGCSDTTIGMQHNKETSAVFAVLRGYRCARFENLSAEIAVPSLQNLHGLPRLNIWTLRGVEISVAGIRYAEHVRRLIDKGRE